MVVADLSCRDFQTYVAISRVKTLEGLMRRHLFHGLPLMA